MANMTITDKGLSRVSRRIIDYHSLKPEGGTLININKVLISDGSIKLTDKSVPVLNHIYNFSVTTVTETSSTLVLQARIDPNVHLTISEIGLYTETENGQELFSYIQGYSLKKEANVGYELLFIINFEINVVNCSALPEIVIKDNPPMKFGVFERLRESYLNTMGDLERIIDNNAIELGYAKELYFNRLELNRNLYLQNSEASLDYSSLNAINFANRIHLRDFYNFLSVPYEYYSIVNLNNPSGTNIEIFGNLLQGHMDSIDLSDIRGFSLCLYLCLPNQDNRLILSKANPSLVSDKYFTFAVEDRVLSFKIFGDNNSEVELRVNIKALRETIVEKPIMFTLTSHKAQNSFYFNLYANSRLVSTKKVDNFAFLNASAYKLTNFFENEDVYGDASVIKKIMTFSGRLYPSDIIRVQNTVMPNF